MPNWYEVFDNEQVQFVTRKQVAHLIWALFSGGLLSLAFVLYTYLNPVSPAISMLVLGGIWINVAAWLLHRYNRLRRLMWCVKLSDRRIVGYDYARRKTVLDWTKVERVELMPDGLLIVGEGHTTIEVSHLFTEFSTLSHRIEAYAMFYGVPVFIEGRPWDEIDVTPLLPDPRPDSSNSD